MIRRNVECFVNGCLQKVDLNEKGRIVVAGVVKPAEAPKGVGDPLKDADSMDGPTKKELMAALKDKGIPFKVTMKTAELAELLSSGAKAEAPKGVGDQDVI